MPTLRSAKKIDDLTVELTTSDLMPSCPST